VKNNSNAQKAKKPRKKEAIKGKTKPSLLRKVAIVRISLVSHSSIG
jgi:hypothetical protein